MKIQSTVIYTGVSTLLPGYPAAVNMNAKTAVRCRMFMDVVIVAFRCIVSIKFPDEDNFASSLQSETGAA